MPNRISQVPNVQTAKPSFIKPLSTRQTQVYLLLLAGLTMIQISVELGIKVSTVRTYSAKLYQKRGITSRRELVQIELDEATFVTPLTQQQVQVLKGILAGQTFKQMAQAMGLALGTVHGHRNKLYKKMGVGTRAQVIAVMTNQQTSRG
jgi:DNA-binding NarL/FixJ family response regulator